MRLVFGVFVLLISFGSVASAQSVEAVVKKNTATALEGYSVYFPNCSFPRIDGRVRGGPKNGKVEIKQLRGTLPESAGECAGEMVTYTGVIYTPDPGFTGTDRFAVDFSRDEYTNSWQRKNHRKTYKVTVQ